MRLILCIDVNCHCSESVMSATLNSWRNLNITTGGRATFDVKGIGLDINGGSLNVAGFGLGTERNDVDYLGKDGNFTSSYGGSVANLGVTGVAGTGYSKSTSKNNSSGEVVGSEETAFFSIWLPFAVFKMENTTYGNGGTKTFIGVDIWGSVGVAWVVSGSLKIGATVTQDP